MIRHSWVTVLTRLAGLFILAHVLPPALSWLYNMLWATLAGTRAGAWNVRDWINWSLHSLGIVVQVFVGAWMTFRPRRIVAWCVRGVDSECPQCGYDVSSAEVRRCAECGLVVRGGDNP